LTESYPIPPRLAEQAAQDYLTLKRAGMLPELRAEIQRTIEAHRGVAPDAWTPICQHDAYHANRLDQWRDCDGMQIAAARNYAKHLAALLDCRQIDVEPFIIPELISGETRRTIVLDVLRNMAGYIRQQRRTAPRRVCS
jgi:hypothetical protein